ncbi:MAG: hypothetical protein KA175_08925 [Flavobacteriales bacterium]|nr:hypothetical protein [Flavobacteriales bacterium]MBP6697727.1 hypothetical protein [Flavobacteriales bacterium]
MRANRTLLIICLAAALSRSQAQTVPFVFPNSESWKADQPAEEKQLSDLLKEHAKAPLTETPTSIRVFLKDQRETNRNERNALRSTLYEKLKADPSDKTKEEITKLKGQFRAHKEAFQAYREDLLRIRYDPDLRHGLYGLAVRRIATEIFYDEFSIDQERSKVLKNSIFSYSGQAQKASLYSEVVYDYFGPVRLGFGALIGNTSADSDTLPITDSSATFTDQIQRLLGGGGNGVLNLGVPIVGFTTLNQRFSTRLQYAPKLSFDIPKIGVDTNVVGQNFDNGAELVFSLTGIKGRMSLFGQVRYSHISGNSLFWHNLGRDDDGGIDLWQFSGGLAINSAFRIVANWYAGDEFVQKNFQFRLGVQIVPNS